MCTRGGLGGVDGNPTRGQSPSPTPPVSWLQPGTAVAGPTFSGATEGTGTFRTPERRLRGSSEGGRHVRIESSRFGLCHAEEPTWDPRLSVRGDYQH